MKKTINVPILARVEGEGALELEVVDNKIKELTLRIYEPPRLFEKFLVGRNYSDVVDVVARICGICPIAYQMSAAHAIESVFGINPGPWVREMRRLFYCGEWIQSHSLHVHLLASPDFLGFNSALEMAEKYPAEVTRGLRLQGIGHDIIELLGARSVNPVGACVGGFYRAPTVAKAKALLAKLRDAEKDAEEMVRWVATLPIPKFEQDVNYVSLKHPDEYPFNEGRLVSSRGMDVAVNEFGELMKESHVAHCTALHSHIDGKPYLTGPLSRINLNYDLFPEKVKKLVEETGVKYPSNNMFDSVNARAIEIYYAILEAIRILENYKITDQPRVEVKPRAGWGYACTEAPRGICWHRYELDENGIVKFSQIAPPTAQNYARIEEDLRTSLEEYGLEHSDDELRLLGEMVIRNYDPCISCSVHFLDLRVNRKNSDY